VTIVLSTVVVFALGLAAVGLAFLVPQRGTVVGQEYAATQAYAFDHLALNTEYLGVDVEAGVLVPVMSRGDVSGVVVFGLGWAKLSLPPDVAAELSQVLGVAEFREDFEAMYLPASYQSLAGLRRLCSAREMDDPEYPGLAQDILDQHAQDQGLLPFFQTPMAAAPVSSPVAARLYTVTYGRVDYLEGPRIALDLAGPVPRNLSFPNPGLAAPVFPQVYVQRVGAVTILLFALLGGLLGLLCLVLTLHVREPEWLKRSLSQGGGLPLGNAPGLETRRAPASVPLAILAFVVVHRALGAGLLGKAYPAWLGDCLVGLGAMLWLLPRRVPPSHFGITTWVWPTAAVAGVVIGFFAVVAGSLGYPNGVRPVPWEGTVILVARAMLVSGPLRELALRGLAQTALERWLGRAGAVFLPAAAAGASYLLGGMVLYGAGRQTVPLLTEALLLIPATNILAGYLYQRLHNLGAPILVTGLAEVLPKVLAF
jgi:hypothetical protein